MHLILAAFGVFFSFLSIGCSPSHEPREAPLSISESFHGTSLEEAALSPSSTQDKSLVTIRKVALDREFLLHGSLIAQRGAPTSRGLKGRIVLFKRIHDRVFLLEAVQGQVVTHDLPASLILAEFPILHETEDALTLDFNRGLQQIFTSRNFYYGEKAAPAGAIRVARSYLDSVRLLGNHFEVRQIAQIQETSGDDFELPTYEARYYLTPYRENPGFSSREAGNFHGVGFFEIAPTLEEGTGRPVSRIVRWDDRRPIVFHVSANTPPEYVEAVREGILYWNAVAGREMVRAELAPPGVTAPDPRFNLVQWVPYDLAGSAYADALMDPRTGEILHAQIFITSTFVFSPKQGSIPLLRRLRRSGPALDLGRAPRTAGIRPLDEGRVCENPGADPAGIDIDTLVFSAADAATALRLSRDYVRITTAHEVGHTLGLRHNFAGSLAATWSLPQRDQFFLDYVLLGQVPRGGILSSTVMEYSNFEDSLLTGAQIADPAFALPYDRLALHWAYNGQDFDPAAAPAFCTDGWTFPDCARFDAGAKPLLHAAWRVSAEIDRAPVDVVEKHVRAKAPWDPRDRLPVANVALDPGEIAQRITAPLRDAVAWFHVSGSRNAAVSIQKQFPFVSLLNREEVLEREQEWIRSQVEEAGGFTRMLFALVPTEARPAIGLAEAASARLSAFLQRPDVRSGTGYDGRPYILSEQELDLIRSKNEPLFRKVEEKVIGQALDILASGKFADNRLGAQIEDLLASAAREIILSQTVKAVPRSLEQAQEFKYRRELRVQAARLLLAAGGEAMDWGMTARADLVKKLTEIVEKAAGGKKLGEISDSTLPRPFRQWLLEQREILKLLN